MRVLGLAPIPRQPQLLESLIESAAVRFFSVRQRAVDVEYQRPEVTRRILRLALRALRYAVPAARKPWVAIPWLPVRRMRRTRVRGVQVGLLPT